MRFFSGFSLKNESPLFASYLNRSDLAVSGFSYGAIQAFEYVLHAKTRVDCLQLFSPAFFQTQTTSYKRLQLRSFKKDPKAYREVFFQNILYPKSTDIQNYVTQGSYETLDVLLNHQWSEKDLQTLVKRGVKIEVYLGKEDKIIQSDLARDFFTPYATVYEIKNVGHIL